MQELRLTYSATGASLTTDMGRTSDERSEIGERIAHQAEARHGRDWKQSDVARDVGFSEATISRAMGAKQISAPLAAALCRGQSSPSRQARGCGAVRAIRLVQVLQELVDNAAVNALLSQLVPECILAAWLVLFAIADPILGKSPIVQEPRPAQACRGSMYSFFRESLFLQVSRHFGLAPGPVR